MSAKVLLTNPPWVKGGVRAGSRWAFTSSVKERVTRYTPFPFFMAYAASVLEKEGIEVKVLDCIASELYEEKFLKEVKKFNPDLIVVETATVSIYNDWKLINVLKEMEFTVAAVGPHATALPDETFENSKADFVIYGEYEYSLLDLVKNLSNPKNVEGIAFINGEAIIKNERRKPVADLDELPYPAWHLLPMDDYNEPFCSEYPNGQMLSSRGCIYNCNFCAFPQLMYGGRFFRAHTPGRVVNEIQELTDKYSIREIYFDDDSFTIDMKRIEKICDLMLKEKIEMPWACMTHMGRTTRDLLIKMKTAGCEGIKFGIENASQELLNSLGKGLSIKQAEKVVKWCKELGIKVHLTFMFGLPGETKQTINSTLHLAKKLDAESAQFSIATPFPGTEFYSMAVENNWLISNDWSKYDGNKQAVISYPDLSVEDLVGALDFARRMYLMKTLTSKRLVKSVENVYEERGWGGLASLLVKKPPAYVKEMSKYIKDKKGYEN